MPFTRNRMIRWIALALALCLVSPASAIRIGDEDRQTLGEYAEAHELEFNELPKLFGAALRVRCPWGVGGAALVARNGTILTAEHLIFGSHAEQNPLRRCFVESLFELRKKLHFDARHFLRGSRLRPDAGRQEQDFVILRLRDNDLIARPFVIGEPVQPGDRVVAFAQGQANWASKPFLTPSVGECQVLAATRFTLHSNCDADRGSSGGPLLEFQAGPDKPPVLVGITVSTPDTDVDCNTERWCTTSHITINSEIAKLVAEVAKL